MSNLIGLTILEQIRLLTPYLLYGGIIFVTLILHTILIRFIWRRQWKREEEERLPETTKRKLSDRDKIIRVQRSHIDKQDKIIERLSVAVRAAAMHNHKVAEILQMPMVNEVAKRRKRA